jgi:hypothetical protein
MINMSADSCAIAIAPIIPIQRSGAAESKDAHAFSFILLSPLGERLGEGVMQEMAFALSHERQRGERNGDNVQVDQLGFMPSRMR